MPKISDKVAQKKFGVKLLIAVLVIVVVFSAWYFVDRSRQAADEKAPAIVSDQRN